MTGLQAYSAFHPEHQAMKPALWRVLWLLLIAAAVAFVFYEITLPQRDDYGMRFDVTRGQPGNIRVLGVEPRSAAARAGIHAGDSIAYGDSAIERARTAYATGGTRVTVTVNGTRRVTMIARHVPPLGVQWPVLFVRLAFLSIAALLAWRRPEDPAARALVVFLWCYGLALSMANGLLPTPLLTLVVLQIGGGVLFIAGTAAAAAFAARFPSGTARRLPRTLAVSAQALAAFSALALVLFEWLPRSSNMVSLLNFAFLSSFIVIALLVVATLVAAYVQGAPSERQRRRWMFFFLGLGLCGLLLDLVVQAIFGLQRWADQFVLLPIGILPIGLAYIILRHRVIDVGFVLNRAVVYTGVSLFVVGIFVIVETLLAKYVENVSHLESTALQLAVALVLGFSIRFIHARVDRVVDTLMFRERHEADLAMRNFAHDAAYMTDASALLERCIAVVTEHAQAAAAGVWLREDDGRYVRAAGTLAEVEAGENDPAVLAMRARRAIVDLHKAASALPGVLAFPMIVRGQLTGILVCGAKSGDEAYAPDEREALAAVAAAVGQALDGLRVTELERTVERLLRAGGATQGAMGTF